MKSGCLAVLIISLLFLASPCFGITLLIEEEALNKIFSTADEITPKKIIASEEKIGLIKSRLGGKLTHILGTKEMQEINQQREFTFYFGREKDKLIGVASIIAEPGKWGPIKFIVRLSPQGRVEAVAVMSYSEIRGRPIVAPSFLRQFIGKTLSAPLKVKADIQGISGATVSSEAACFAVKKAMVLYKELISQ